MKHFHGLSGLSKVCLSLLIVAVAFLSLDGLFTVFSLSPTGKYSDTDLYRNAFECEKKGNHLCALLYLFAYKTREPVYYMLNASYKLSVDDEYKRLVGIMNEALVFQRKVNADLNACQCYPCGYCEPTGRGTYSANPTPVPKIIQTPPDTAVVCEDFDYQGRCMFLTVGDYNHPEQIGLPNDSISSIMVGSAVTLTLCANGGMTGYCTTFGPGTQDANLSNNLLVDQYSWNDNTTSARVAAK